MLNLILAKKLTWADMKHKLFNVVVVKEPHPNCFDAIGQFFVFFFWNVGVAKVEYKPLPWAFPCAHALDEVEILVRFFRSRILFHYTFDIHNMLIIKASIKCQELIFLWVATLVSLKAAHNNFSRL